MNEPERDGYEYPKDLVDGLLSDPDGGPGLFSRRAVLSLARAAHREHERAEKAEALLEEAVDYMVRHRTGDDSADGDMDPMLDAERPGWREGDTP